LKRLGRIEAHKAEKQAEKATEENCGYAQKQRVTKPEQQDRKGPDENVPIEKRFDQTHGVNPEILRWFERRLHQ
jgi:hypothetical protein